MVDVHGDAVDLDTVAFEVVLPVAGNGDQNERERQRGETAEQTDPRTKPAVSHGSCRGEVGKRRRLCAAIRLHTTSCRNATRPGPADRLRSARRRTPTQNARISWSTTSEEPQVGAHALRGTRYGELPALRRADRPGRPAMLRLRHHASANWAIR